MNRLKFYPISNFPTLLLDWRRVIYALGLELLHYLGHVIDWQAYWLGQTWVTLLQLSMILLNIISTCIEELQSSIAK